MKLAPAVSGDVGDTRTISLAGIDDLSSVTSLKAHVWRWDAAVVELTATVADAGAGTITVNLGGVGGWLSTAAAGSWFIEYELTFGTTVLTWPSERPDVLPVRAEGEGQPSPPAQSSVIDGGAP